MIELTNVTKSFSKLCAVDQVSATIREGLIFGLVGSNGAGKVRFCA
jgi:ABC-2 type transport system ATP-binding protein